VMTRGSYVPSFALRQERDHVAAPDLTPVASASARSELPASYGETTPKRPSGREGGPAAPVAPAPPITPAWWRSLAVVGFFAGVVTAIVVAGAMSRRNATETAQASSGPSIAVLLFQHYSASADDAIVAARLTDAVTTELARIGTVAVVSRASVSQYTGEMRPAREIAKALNVDFIMESTLTVESANLHVVTRLVDGTLDRKVWVGEYDTAAGEIRELARRIAAEAAAGALKYKSTH
jgi:TolB-like protein